MNVLYKGHSWGCYPQLCTALSFTLIYKGHTIVIGPERASRYLRNFALKYTSAQSPGGTP